MTLFICCIIIFVLYIFMIIYHMVSYNKLSKKYAKALEELSRLHIEMALSKFKKVDNGTVIWHGWDEENKTKED